MKKPIAPNQPKKPIPPKEFKPQFIRKAIDLCFKSSSDNRNDMHKYHTKAPTNCRYFCLADLIKQLPNNSNYENIFVIFEEPDYQVDEDWIADVTYAIPLDETEIKQKYLKDLEIYGEALCKWKEDLEQWEKGQLLSV